MTNIQNNFYFVEKILAWINFGPYQNMQRSPFLSKLRVCDLSCSLCYPGKIKETNYNVAF